MLQFNAEQLGSAILDLQHTGFCGVAYVEPLSSTLNPQQTRVLSFYNGELTYAGLSLPEPSKLSRKLGEHFNLKIMDAALQLASKKVEKQSSIRQYLELYIRLELFSWQDIESFVRSQIIQTLEKILPHGGMLKLNDTISVDLSFGEDSHGFTWQKIEQAITQRQRAWASFLPTITSTEAIPYQVQATQQTITDPRAQQHLQRWIDGQRTLGDIAIAIDKDPLELAHSYMHYVQMGWITFNPNPNNYRPAYKPIDDRPSITSQKASVQKLPTILSVDDSPVVQTMIKRALGEQYNLLLANNAMDALNLLNRESTDLLLLDVTMPDIDGLELCRTIRKINKFRDLPIIMLTAKDGMFNKIKGQMAGSTHYLTKPIDRQKLMEVLDQYIPNTVMS
ncbi:MAG: response regulator [Cyanobacteria bacterium P01_H01_bin.105]